MLISDFDREEIMKILGNIEGAKGKAVVLFLYETDATLEELMDCSLKNVDLKNNKIKLLEHRVNQLKTVQITETVYANYFEKRIVNERTVTISDYLTELITSMLHRDNKDFQGDSEERNLFASERSPIITYTSIMNVVQEAFYIYFFNRKRVSGASEDECREYGERMSRMIQVNKASI